MVNNEDKVVDMVFKQKLEQQQKLKKQKRRRRNRRFFTFLLIVGVLTFYFMTDLSKPKAITIRGNELLSKEEILNTAKIDTSSNLLYANPIIISSRLKKHPFITSVSTKSSLFKRVINIEVSELKIFGYRQSEDTTTMILSDGKSEELTSELYKFLPDLIYVSGFEEEEDQVRLVESFKELDDSIIGQISEIHQTSVSYDEKLIKILMKNGNQVFTSFQTVERLNYYLDIIKQLDAQNNCLYIDEMSGQVISQQCPVDE